MTLLSGPALVAEAFAALVLDEPEIRSAYDHEPEKIGRRPSVAMLWVQIAQEDRSTGPATENEWHWRVGVYVDLGSGQATNYRKAQLGLYDAVPAVLRTVREHPDINGTCEWCSIADEGEEPVFDKQNRTIAKYLRLVARGEVIG